jgi:hypothetical protein
MYNAQNFIHVDIRVEMKNTLLISFLAVSITFTGCASIISGSSQTVSFKSVPESAQISITNRNGEKVHTGQTPATVTLKKGAGYFKPENYQVVFSKDGYQTKTVNVQGTVNGWYVANILFGGLIGLLIVDPATGAMYSLSPSDVNAVLDMNDINTNSKDKILTVILKEDIPNEIMVRAKVLN